MNETTTQNTSTTNTASSNSLLKLGTYSINEEPVNPGEGSGIESVQLSNNKFSINLVYGGTSYTGNYTIDKNILICKATKIETEEGWSSSKSSNTIFEFEILNTNKIKFSGVKNSDDAFELNVGLTYSIQ